MKIPFNTNAVKLTSPFGYRILNNKRDYHGGYDLVGIGSHDVVAVVGGTVMQSRIVTDKNNSTWQWGNYVCIKTADGQYHYYCHLKSRSVVKGQVVKAGTKIGVMGNTGYSFGAHLHFEVRAEDGKAKVCPESVLSIPNQVGTYTKSQLDYDLEVLQKYNVINTPEYWRKTAPTVKYLPELIHNMAEELK